METSRHRVSQEILFAPTQKYHRASVWLLGSPLLMLFLYVGAHSLKFDYNGPSFFTLKNERLSFMGHAAVVMKTKQFAVLDEATKRSFGITVNYSTQGLHNKRTVINEDWFPEEEHYFTDYVQSVRAIAVEQPTASSDSEEKSLPENVTNLVSDINRMITKGDIGKPPEGYPESAVTKAFLNFLDDELVNILKTRYQLSLIK
ncbi:MAG: hypothetical protein HRT45_13645 [Bdellovibrionales bacterium]|nr:hypothetical protein [Bdellovibrionales bacterium]